MIDAAKYNLNHNYISVNMKALKRLNCFDFMLTTAALWSNVIHQQILAGQITLK